MYRFLLHPKWIGFHLLVALGIVTMVSLGFWQLDRLEQRQEFNAVIEERYDAPARPIDEILVADIEPDDVEWRPVVATGTYRPDATIRIVNRSQNGFAGDNVVVPMDLVGGGVVLVNRGFLPLGSDIPPAPDGEVTVTGRLRASQQRRTGQLTDPPDGVLSEAQRVDIERLAPQVGGDLAPMYLDVVASDPADSAALEPVVAPDLSDGPHLSYAMQWFIFAIAAAIGWVLAVRRSIRTRRLEVSRAADAPEAAPTP